ncbi:CAP domain-containing protein [Actinoplanes siamensis]|uniref:SCP domain-containing protein n=1 Tax=Actinoplanes siamensis TaxID=1223317 RepID=A0A919NCG2_9ACTN|nr:CAP domain-containing protein [Actinoplanes siamensis]GIF08115.1 hypothetical protein Asi03nite_56530 [Actinoplanes siamensis]
MSLSAAARLRYTLAAGSTAVVIGSGFIVAGLGRPGSEPAPQPADVPLAAAAAPSGGAPSGGARPEKPEPPEEPSASPSPSRTVRPSSSAPAVKKTTAAPKKTRTTTRVTAGGGARSTADSVLQAVLSHINAARADEGLDALTLDAALSEASAKHNALMINGCGLKHECDGEAKIGERFVGVQWRTAGENIGFGSSQSGAAAMIAAANGLTDSMLAEVPPNDGHRKNLLNADFTRIGLSVVRDSQGRTWMTQDFVG